MSDADPAHVLVVVHAPEAPGALLEAIRDRVARGPCWFHVLVPAPPGRGGGERGRRTLAEALPLVEAAAHRPVDGSASPRSDPMDAIEETLFASEFDEIILATPPRPVLRRLRADLPHRVAHLGLPVTTVAVP